MYIYKNSEKFSKVLMSKSAYDRIDDKRYLNKKEEVKVEEKVITKSETGPIIPAKVNKMSTDTKKLIKFGAKAGILGIAAAIVYSPGLLALSVFDASILKATLAVVLGIAFVAGLGYSTYQFFAPDKKQIKTLNSSLDVTELSNKLTEHTTDIYMGKLAKQALTQVDRLNRNIKKVEFELSEKFAPSSMTYKNFYGAVDNAGTCAFENLNSFATRLRLYDDQDYITLQNYKHDDIPDEIQEKQLELLEQNKDLAKDALAANEQLILGLEELAMKLADSNFTTNSDKNEELIEELNKLTDTIKYYI